MIETERSGQKIKAKISKIPISKIQTFSPSEMNK